MKIELQIIILIVYIAGFFLSYSMLRIDHVAEKKVYTKGDKLINYCLSILSLLSVLIILIIAWGQRIKATGYWNLPVNETIEKPKTPAE